MCELWTSFQDRISLLTSESTPATNAHKRPLHKPCYTQRMKTATQRRRKVWKNSESNSCDAAFLCFQQEQHISKQILLAERLSCEWKLANSAKTGPKKFTHLNRNEQLNARILQLLHPSSST